MFTRIANFFKSSDGSLEESMLSNGERNYANTTSDHGAYQPPVTTTDAPSSDYTQFEDAPSSTQAPTNK